MGAGESGSSSLTYRLEGLDAVHGAVEAGRLFYADAGLTPADGARMVIMIEELVTNLIEHGGVPADGIIEMMLVRADQAVTVVLTDPGLPFDPRGAAPSEELPPDRGGGAGLDLVLAWAEVIDYQSAEGRNRLELRMPLEDHWSAP
jgi:anti-sigma regulatory factor (Ser/Thr protein kinase)